MISDTLFQATSEIERYLNDTPHAYEDTRSDIEAILADMRAIQQTLDTPPSEEE